MPGTLAAALEAPPGFARIAFHAGAGAPLAEAGAARRPPGSSPCSARRVGLTDREVEACLDAGCGLATLGPRVLRAETAAVAAAALLQHLAGDLG